MASAQSYLIVTEAKRTPEVVASGTYIDTLMKDANGKWRFVQRKLDIDLVNDSKQSQLPYYLRLHQNLKSIHRKFYINLSPAVNMQNDVKINY